MLPHSILVEEKHNSDKKNLANWLLTSPNQKRNFVGKKKQKQTLATIKHQNWGRAAFFIGAEPHGEKAMAPHSSTLAWKIPWTEEPGRLQSMGSLGVRHD